MRNQHSIKTSKSSDETFCKIIFQNDQDALASMGETYLVFKTSEFNGPLVKGSVALFYERKGSFALYHSL